MGFIPMILVFELTEYVVLMHTESKARISAPCFQD